MDVAVLSAQKALIAKGYFVGNAGADGILGRGTQAALRKFQSDAKLPIQYPGTLGPITLTALGVPGVSALVDPPWISEARRFVGLHETRDAKKLDDLLNLDASEIAWCGGFVGLCLATVLPREDLPSNPLGSRNWLKLGTGLQGPQIGATAVFWRGLKSGWQGHVGFVVGHDQTHLHILGGNQSDSVSIARIDKARLLGYRWPITFPAPPSGALPMSSIKATITENEA